MFIYPILNIIKRHGVHYHCYADDIQIYMQCKNTNFDIQESVTRLQNCILKIGNWMMVNSLKINGNKTKFIIFGSKPATYINCSLKISFSSCIKIIGVSLVSMLNLNKHISNTCRTVYAPPENVTNYGPACTRGCHSHTLHVLITRGTHCQEQLK